MNFNKRYQYVSSLSLTFLVSIYFMLGMNFVFLSKIYEILKGHDDVNIIFMMTVPLVFFSAFTFIFSPFISRFIAKPFLILIIMT
ncbi:MAG: hypothetical protein ACPG05_04580, partial [Bdellovibrionales bacterium]